MCSGTIQEMQGCLGEGAKRKILHPAPYFMMIPKPKVSQKFIGQALHRITRGIYSVRSFIWRTCDCITLIAYVWNERCCYRLP